MLHKAIPNRERLAQAKVLEAEEEIPEAIKVYKSVLASEPLNETAIGRLLVLYRRQKAYKEELALLRAAISAYEGEQLAARETWRKKHQKAARLSLSLAQKLGMGGQKKTAGIFDVRVVTVWRKRKEVVMRRVKDNGHGLRVVESSRDTGKSAKDMGKSSKNKVKLAKDMEKSAKDMEKLAKAKDTAKSSKNREKLAKNNTAKSAKDMEKSAKDTGKLSRDMAKPAKDTVKPPKHTKTRRGHGG